MMIILKIQERHIIPFIFILSVLVASCGPGNELPAGETLPTDLPGSSITDSESDFFMSSPLEIGVGRTFGLEIADIDLDGDNDLFVANYVGPSKLWINDGTGTFSDSGISFNTANDQIHDVGIADLTGDSYPDIFLIAHGNPSKVFFNDGSGNFSDSQQNIGAASDNPQWIEIGDIDNDGDVDVFFIYANSANRLWLNDGEGFFTKSDIEFGGMTSPAMIAMDFNGDQSLDLFLCFKDQPPEVLLNDGSGLFSAAQQKIGSLGGCDWIDGGDIDGDGDNDLVVTIINSGIKIWLNENNSGSFSEAGPGFYRGTIRIKLIDADLDGDLDLIASNINSDETRLWLNEGSEFFQPTDQVFGTAWVIKITAGKLDLDDHFDVVIGNEDDFKGIEIYFGK